MTVIAISENKMVRDGAKLNAAPGFRSTRQLQEAAQQPDRLLAREGSDNGDLGRDVEREHRDGNGDERPDPAVWQADLEPGRGIGLPLLALLVGCHRPGQRRSSRCLQDTHRVARGKA